MALSSGVRLGPYTITAKLGAGGMGEVYRATDTRLGRQVAIKVLPPEVALDPERLGRFRREAQLLASLNHPSIATLYGLDEADGKPFLVMELVEGEDLRQRLKRGAIPVDEALDLSRQIATALEAAHEKGIVHRDLKPANVKTTAEGKIKVLDFGLAKALGTRGESGSGADSPTVTEAATTEGTILGTVAYMSPEQARGKSVDKRTDIWAFGVVLHEMLTGKPLFQEETASDTLAAVLTREPSFTDLPATLAPRVRTLLERCLRKDPQRRLHDIGDARIELEDAAAGPTPVALAPVPRRRSWRWLLPGLVLVLAAGVLAGALLARRLAVTEPPTFRQISFGLGFVHSARFAPDGQTVVYGAALDGRPLALYSTRTDAFASRTLDVGEADVAGIARDGRMALLLHRHHTGTWLRVGTLATVALSGGTPREVLEHVFDADISPDGEQLAAVIQDGDHQVLQFPIGKELYRTQGWISDPRISSDGQRVAFVHHRVWADDLGDVRVVGLDGKVVEASPEFQYLMGLAWAPDGETLWFSAGEDPGGGLLATTTAAGGGGSGKGVRHVLRVPTLLRVQDVGEDGRLLALADTTHVMVAGRLAGDTQERVYAASSNESIMGISDDGVLYAGDNADIVINGEYAVFVRRSGGAPLQLGMGAASGLTRDGKFVFATGLSNDVSVLRMLPVGAGQAREFDLGGLVPLRAGGGRASCSSDGKRVAFVAGRAEGGRQAWVMDVEGQGKPHPVSPDGAFFAVLSPDGTKVAIGDLRRGLYVVPADGRAAQEVGPSNEPLVPTPVPVPGLPKESVPLAWTPDGTGLLTWDRTLPPRIYRTEIPRGGRTLVHEIAPPDPQGLLYGFATFSANGKYHLMRYRRMLSQVYVVEMPEGMPDVFLGLRVSGTGKN